MGTNSENVLEIKDLKKYYEEVKAVDGISFEIKRGEIYGLLGPNGAGKTTTIKCILGLLGLEGGFINVLGKNPQTDPENVKSLVGYVSEEPLLFKSMTPEELFNFIASIRNLDPGRTTEKIQQLLESLDAMQYYKKAIVTLSRGNQQKIQLIAAMMHDPPLLVLDEPLSGLDARTSRIVKDLLRLHANRGGAVLLSTHIMEQASELCSRIGIINKGKMIAEGTLNELRQYANASGASLEDVFLKLTEQEQDVREIMERFRKEYQRRSKTEV
ncbi:MAG: ABC transporter ATP-binding protein [Promethearchaeota archaeon]